MDIFTEVNNRSYVVLKELIMRLCYVSQGLTRQEILRFLTDSGVTSGEFHRSLFNEHPDNSFNYQLLVQDKAGKFILQNSQALPLRPLASELKWLKYILKDQQIGLFLEPETLNYLNQILGTEELHWHKYLEIRREASPSETANDFTLRENLLMIVQAIREQKVVRYCATTRQGKLFMDQISLPYKIEYSMKHDEFYVIMLNIQDGLPVKALLRNLFQIHCEDYDPQHGQSLISMMESKKHDNPIVLEIIDNQNALERSLLTFATYEKSAHYDRERRIHILKIFYYNFDESELLSKILSIGKWIKVISPVWIKDEAISRIRKATNLY